MQRIIMACLIGTAVICFSGTMAAQEKHTGQEKREGTKQAKEVYTCPMHPEVQSDKPGKCPKCGMNLIADEGQQKDQIKSRKQSEGLTAKEKIQKAKELLAEAKEEMYYNCCVKNPCDRCALDHQSCDCAKDIGSGKGICSDCYAGWQLGEGKDVPGMTKEKVKPNFHGHKH